MKEMTGLEIMEVLQTLGELEWGRCRAVLHTQDLSDPPLTVWRYKKRNLQLESLIVQAVESFQGNVEWKIEFTGKNWVIAPKKLQEFQEERGYRRDVEALNALAKEEPEFGMKANLDVPVLAEKIKQTVSVFQIN
ncbi:MAG: hypothetical protein DSM107014_03620 [Gomphosphaeria aponina SAG 52.96 = DSM 107014]|uniref:Uncharacterized protein n=1 Tax=Gomphosphaeria aponina SAG 52.96 = DSM 107014 TaxID=1521640 RepID=A0A941GWZ6_9CHRO|nr:hypothetical protein [Gomphosphaeria aponina SAG 52.96 = DSM 107014]